MMYMLFGWNTAQGGFYDYLATFTNREQAFAAANHAKDGSVLYGHLIEFVGTSWKILLRWEPDPWN